MLYIPGKVIGIMQFGGVLGKMSFGYISNVSMNMQVSHKHLTYSLTPCSSFPSLLILWGKCRVEGEKGPSMRL